MTRRGPRAKTPLMIVKDFWQVDTAAGTERVGGAACIKMATVVSVFASRLVEYGRMVLEA